MMKPSEVLKALAISPKKRFGQNFLTDERVLTDIVEAAMLKAGDTVVEIGPGLGVLTSTLAKQAKRVIAIEADPDLAHYLRNHTAKNVTIITGDALQIDWHIDIAGEYKIVANIPYSITSPLLRKICNLSTRPSAVVLLVQKEVAERLTAVPKTRARGLLTVLTEAVGEVEVIRKVKPGSFYPAPKVDSAVIRLTFQEDRRPDIFWPYVEAGFRHKRQTLANALQKERLLSKGEVEEALVSMGLTTMARAEELSLEQWVKFSQGRAGV